MMVRKKFKLRIGGRAVVLGERTLIMGVLNVTPDSFSDGGKFYSVERAVAGALQMELEGADLLDIGAESTRPGSQEVSVEEEVRRLLPVLNGLRGRLKIPISVDTRKSVVAEAALKAGAQLINDISGLNHDPRLAGVAARRKVPLILMRMRGTPETMQKAPFAKNVFKDVKAGLRNSIVIARKAGVAKSQILIDPGIGFGKSYEQNYELIARLGEIAKLGYPLLVGTSRKGFLGATLADEDGKPAPPEKRIWGTAATVTASILNGAHVVRVHDVAEMKQVAKVADCVMNGGRDSTHRTQR